MKRKDIAEVKSREEARQIAIKWQSWQSKRRMSYAELAEWSAYFENLAILFYLEEEFKENGII